MTPGREDPADAAKLAAHAAALGDAIEAALPGWVDRSVRQVLADQGIDPDRRTRERIDEAAGAAVAEGGPRVRTLLETDIDEQRTNPLAVLRSLVGHPTAVLREAGAQPVARDDFKQRAFPDDVYDLSPASFAEVDPLLHEPGLAWGAAKAYVHLSRRRREGRR